MANAELMQSEDTPDEDKKKYSENIQSTTYQMRSLVENMLEMARVDNGNVKMNFSKLDFSQLVSDAALSFQLLYEEKGMSLRCAGPDAICIHGSEQHLYQLLDMLLDNALKYSAPGGMVSVDLTLNGRICILSVSSPGAPISKEDLKNIFKRFYAVFSLKSGDDVKTVQQNLGHETFAFTLDTYGHVTEKMKKDSADRMQAFIKSVS